MLRRVRPIQVSDITFSRGVLVLRSWIPWLLLPIACVLAAGASAAPPAPAHSSSDFTSPHEASDEPGTGNAPSSEGFAGPLFGDLPAAPRSVAGFGTGESAPAMSEALQGLLCVLLLLAARQGLRDS